MKWGPMRSIRLYARFPGCGSSRDPHGQRRAPRSKAARASVEETRRCRVPPCKGGLLYVARILVQRILYIYNI